MITAAMESFDVRTWADALPLLLVSVVFCVFGLWMILFPENARRFMDDSQKKRDVWFNRQDAQPTPRYFPRLLGFVFVAVTVAVSVVLVVVVASSG